MTVPSNTIFAKAYNSAFKAIMAHKKERYTFTGGRASCKSSFIAICIVLLIVMFPDYNALVIRKTAKTLRRSVFEQIVWAIRLLHLENRFQIPRSQTAALPIIHNRGGGIQQRILFAGCDDPEKIKSLKTASGYFAILWVEEKTEFHESELQNIRISALRGGKTFYIFESYNPPSATRHWCNIEARTPDSNRMVIHTTYLDIPAAWLGEAILHDIAHTKETNERAYRNIYLGEATGTGLNVFENVKLQPITDNQIKAFDYIYRGVDWGYYPDPFQYVVGAYQKATLYIFDEFRLYKHGNIEAFNALKDHMNNQYDRYRYDTRQKGEKDRIESERITADSAEPKSIADFRAFGADMRGAIKGAGSRDTGFKWLQGLDAIIIDPTRCPHAADEFTLYEYEIDKRSGDIMSGYPDGQPDHCMDAVRYAMETVYRRAGA